MPESMIQMAGALGGFAGLAFLAVVWYIGRKVEWLCEAWNLSVRTRILEIIHSPHVTNEAKAIAAEVLSDSDSLTAKLKGEKK